MHAFYQSHSGDGEIWRVSQPDAIAAFMAAESEIIDSLGNRLKRSTKIDRAWERYFNMATDYSISHSEILAASRDDQRREDFGRLRHRGQRWSNNGKITV